MGYFITKTHWGPGDQWGWYYWQFSMLDSTTFSSWRVWCVLHMWQYQWVHTTELHGFLWAERTYPLWTKGTGWHAGAWLQKTHVQTWQIPPWPSYGRTIKNKSNQDWLCETLGLGNQSFLQNITMWIIPRLSQIKPWSCPNTGFQYMILSTATALFTNKWCIDVPKDFRLLVLVAVMDEFHLVKPIILCYQRWHHGSLSWGWPWKDFFSW